MTPVRGRPLRFMTLLFALWIGARLVLLNGPSALADDDANIAPKPIALRVARPSGPAMPFAPPAATRAAMAREGFAWPLLLARTERTAAPQAGAPLEQSKLPLPTQTAHWPSPSAALSPAMPPTAVPLTGTKAARASRGPDHEPVLRPPGPAPVQPGRPPDSDRPAFSLYSYAYYRPGEADGSIGAARYGGSQAGALASYRLGGSADGPVELLARISHAPADPDGLEAGAGLRWTPTRGLSLAVEYRQRAHGVGTAIAYAAGGAGPIPLPGDAALELYGQAGLYDQNGLHGFYDAQASVLRPVLTADRLTVAIGAGIWSGGTEDVQRLDIGPRLATRLPIGAAMIALNADYRLRIAGQAAPDSGPAITLTAIF